MKLNNKGFAITAVLYGLLILFVLLVSSYLVVLSVKKDRVDTIVNEIENDYKYFKLNQYISDLYLNSSKEEKEQNGVIYYYSYQDTEKTWGLMNDRLGGVTENYNDGNIRYYGANPNNYIDIGDRDKDNKVILYRIIGVFKNMELEDGTKKDLVKVIRAESIGDFSWDNKTNSIGSSQSDNGSNEWSDSRLMMLLNPGYENKKDSIYEYEGSLYWNSKRGTCYSGEGNAVRDCDFSSIGLSEVAKKYIEDVKWNLGGYDTVSRYSNEIYISERSNKVFENRNTTWSGKIGLMYPSDYAYAVDFSKCAEMMTVYGNKESCYKNDWLFLSNIQWTITPWSDSSFKVRRISPDSLVVEIESYRNYTIRPTFYLKGETTLKSGDGSILDPYQVYVG